MADTLLALNSGSSSLKFALFDADGAVVRLRGRVTGLHEDRPRLRVEDARGAVIADERWQGMDESGGVERVVTWIERHLGDDSLVAAGHRIVHGGSSFTGPVPLDAETIRQLEALSPLAPLHQPASLLPVRQLAAFRPGLLQVACFDTAFHHGLVPPASRYALPRAMEDDGIRRYGFHGLSYESIAATLAAGGEGAAEMRIVVAHLGSGASLCAMHGLRSVDTTMGFSTLDGLVMGTRPGSLDPGILLYLMREKGYDADQLERLLYHESGLLGVSGVSGEVEALLASDRPEAAEAIDLFAYSAAQHVAALATSLGGLDQLVFTGGIGERSSQVRAAISDRLRWLGLDLDAERNRKNAPVISTSASTIPVAILPTDEEAVIARHVAAVRAAAALQLPEARTAGTSA